MAVEIWTTEAKTEGTQVQVEIGRIDGATGGETSMTLTEESDPDEIRLYRAGSPHGITLTIGSRTGTTQAFSGETVVAGDIIIAFKGDVKIFGSDYVIGNSSTASDRWTEMPLWIFVSGSNETDVTLDMEDLLSGEGAAADWFTFTDTGTGDAGDYSGKVAGDDLNVGDITSGNNKKIWVRLQVVEGTAKQNARDVLITVSSLSAATT